MYARNQMLTASIDIQHIQNAYALALFVQIAKTQEIGKRNFVQKSLVYLLVGSNNNRRFERGVN